MAKWTQSSKLQVQDKIIYIQHEAKRKQTLLHVIWLTALILSVAAVYLIK